MIHDIKIAVVTGGGHGIGRATCRRLQQEGIAVAVADLDGDAADTVAAEIGGNAFSVDVGDESQINGLVDAVEGALGPIDLFVSNAGVGYGDGESGAAAAEGGIP